MPDQEPAVIADRIEGYLQSICPPGARVSVTRLAQAEAVLTPLDHPATLAAARALEIGFGAAPFYTREGGSIPVVATFKRLLGLPTVLIGFGLPDEPLHAPNERFDLEDYFRGACTSVALLDELAR